MYCNRRSNSRSGSSKVIDSDTNQRHVCGFLFVIASNHGPVLHHFGDMGVIGQNCNFYQPLFLLPLLGGTFLNFWMNVIWQKLETSVVHHWRFCDPVWLCFDFWYSISLWQMTSVCLFKNVYDFFNSTCKMLKEYFAFQFYYNSDI